MAELENDIKRIKFIERVLLLSVFMALIVHYVFHYQATLFLEVFALALALLYFPLGFYSIGKPSEKFSNTISIILGFVYALGILSLLLSAVNIDSYRYPLIIDFFVLLAIVIYLVFKMKSAAYPSTYINAQFIRIGFIIFCGLIILVK